MLRLLLRLVISGFQGFRLSCTLLEMFHYNEINETSFESSVSVFQRKERGTGVVLFAHGLDNDSSISRSNVKFNENDLLPSPKHQPLSLKRHGEIRTNH